MKSKIFTMKTMKKRYSSEKAIMPVVRNGLFEGLYNPFFSHLLVLRGKILFIAFLCLPMIVALPAMAQEKPGWMDWGEKYWPEKPVRGGYVREAADLYVGSMNPNHMVMDWITLSNIYERLVVCDRSYRPTIPWLAESWEYIDDVTVLMKLRKGILFHDGSPFNARSVKCQMDWIMDKDNAAWTRVWMEPLKSVEIVDEYTVKWHFKRPWGSFLGALANPPGFMISAKALERDAALTKTKKFERELASARRKAGDKDAQKAAEAKKNVAELEAGLKELAPLARNARPLDTSPVGTGPYVLESSSSDNYITLKRNPSWWFGKSVGMPEMPYFDGKKISVIPDPSVRLANLKAGKIDAMRLNANQYRLVKDDPKLDVVTFPVNFLIFLVFNDTKGPCSDIRVRQAISHAIDRKALVMGTQFGLGRISSCVFPDDHWAHNPGLKPVSYDPELSRKLLVQAGYGGGLTLRGFTLNSPEAQSFAKAVMAMLEKVGISWKPVFLGIAGMLEPARKADYDVVGMMYPFIIDPDQAATMMYDPDSPFNNGRSRNPKAIALIREGRETTDQAKRVRIYQQLEKVLYDNYEDAWLWWPDAVLALSRNVRGFNLDMFMKYNEGYYFSHPQWFREGHP